MPIRLADLAKLYVNPEPETPVVDPEFLITAIFKVRKPGYVPAGVEVRSRIDAEMFTGSVRAARLKSLARDKKVVSVSPAETLPIIR